MKFTLPAWLQENMTVEVLGPPYEQASLLPFLQATRISGTFGSMLLQQVNSQDYTIYNHNFRMKQTIDLEVDISQPMITLSYALSGNVPFLLHGFGDAVLTEGWYHMYYIPEGNYSASIPEGETTIFQVNLFPQQIQGLGRKYPAVKDVLEKTENSSREGVQQHAAKITPRVRDLLNSIYLCRLDDAERSIFIQARINDLILLYAEELGGKQRYVQSQYHFTKEDLRALHSASAILASKLHQQLSQRELAREVHLHPRKLAAGFRLLYGVSMQEWLLRLRMDRARRMLTDSDARIGDIAYEVGYDTVSGFIRAFRSYTGYTPADYRK
ncbi:MAG TPA: AraC family transcriptional regulator [Chitinophaga sp.]|uniref:helix-turn-helix domain-containing protein n=1 Tax=Chitinophaga sp. TaxID=1869181 RepID=UPI002C50A4B9|nr:AraC family transcriptional regulator [Chitinophaga sp.]HVI44215.1 AraC family transcriptional regulator [Chitinophaga sp.]